MTNLSPLIEKARQKGSEEAYADWLRQWPSWLTNTFDQWFHGDGKSIYCHVLDVAEGSGKGYKPPFVAVPMTNLQHQNQHQHGYSYYADKEVYMQVVGHYLQMYVDGVQPPEQEFIKQREVFEFEIFCAGQIKALYEISEAYFKANKGVMLNFQVEPVVGKRSQAQNKALWKVIYGSAVDGLNSNPASAEKFLNDYVELKLNHGNIDKDMVHDFSKLKYNMGRSSTRMSKRRFSAYVDCISLDFPENYQVPIDEIKKTDLNY